MVILMEHKYAGRLEPFASDDRYLMASLIGRAGGPGRCGGRDRGHSPREERR